MSKRVPDRKPRPAPPAPARPAPAADVRPFAPAPPSHTRLAGGAPVQAKLTVTPAHDPYEQEADRVADAVMRQAAAAPAAAAAPDSVQRAPLVQLRAAGADAAGPVAGEVERGIEAARGGGSPLPAGLQAAMGGAIGHDFSQVRIHADAGADALSRSLSARAFTTGGDIFFRQGAYQPDAASGQRLLAHELAHVVQQGGGAAVAQRAADSAHLSGCGCTLCAGQGPAGLIQREGEGDVAVAEPEAPKGRARANAVGPQEGKAQFIAALMASPDKRSILNHIPSTGTGRFDAEYLPLTGELIITVKPFLNFNGPWTETEKKEFGDQFVKQAQDKWSGKYTMSCTKAGFEDLVVTPRIVVDLVDDVSAAHFNITVNHQKVGDTFIGREQYSDPSKISSGQFGRQDAPERAHDNLKTRCQLANHDLDRVEGFLAAFGVKEVGFTPEGEIDPASLAGIQKAVAAINSTALPSATPLPLLVTGFDVGGERGVFKADKASQRAAKVAAALGGLTGNPVVTRTIKQEIAEQQSEIEQNLKAYKQDSNKGYKKDGYWHGLAKDKLDKTIAGKDAKKATIEGDAKWAASYKDSDPYSILAHEFGHMLGNPDEYFGYGPKMLDRKIIELSSSGDPAKLEQAKSLAGLKGKANPNMDGDRADIQDKWGQLVQDSGQELPDFTQKGSSATTSIMNAGADLLPAHYATLWEALGRITSAVVPAVQPSDWKLG